jgi:hypothetical protein
MYSDSYEDFDDDYEMDEEEILESLNRCLIHVNPRELEELSIELTERFQQEFGYGIRLELEEKTFQLMNGGYVAAHFTPVKYNETEKYYTLIVNPHFKRIQDGYKYILEFYDGLYNEDGTDKDLEDIDVLSKSNNYFDVIWSLIEHWKTQE